MGVYDAERELAELLDKAREQVRSVTPERRPGGERGYGVGESAGGLVQARMAADGRLAELTLDEGTSGMSRSELQREVVAAVNAAWALSRGADEAGAAVASLDPDLLHEQLAEVQAQGMRSMHRITEGLRDAMREIDRSTRR